MGIKAGVVVVNRYCSPGSKMFFSYIDYMDREEAIRNETVSEYNLFNDYMGNPKKTSGLFTDGKSELTKEEISKLKERFSMAQENQSLMWQTVISFDNRWLEEQGMYDSRTGVLNERKLKEISDIAINKMLKNENLEHAIWTAAFHYNTDNIHIHVATVEEVPKRERKLYQQYSYVTNEKNRLVKDGMVVDLKGIPVFEEEYKGKFKLSSFESGKQYIVKEITKDKDLNQDINKMIRERMVRAAKTSELMRDPELAQMVLELKEKLPDVSKNLWNYNNNIMFPYRSELDRIADYYLEKYHGEEYARLKQMIKMQSDMYRKAYGESAKDRNYERTKMQDLHTRMGNSILKTIRSMNNEKTPEDGTYFFEVDSKTVDKMTGILPEKEIKDWNEDYYLVWEKDFKKARYQISKYSLDKEKTPIEHAYDALHMLDRMDRHGSILAKYELGTIYKYGKIDIQDDEFAFEYYQDALKGYEYIYDHLDEYLSDESTDNQDEKFYSDYISYRIGQIYNKGLGTDVDYQKARQYFEISNSSYAKYALGELYFDGSGVEQDYGKAAENYQKAIGEEKPNPYAFYRLGQMHLKGLHFEQNSGKANEYFENALSGFKAWDNGTDMFLKYRIGYMYYNGYGTDENLAQAIKYFEESMKLGNSNAKYTLGLIYTDEELPVYDLEKGLAYLEELIQEENELALCKAGVIYLDKNSEVFDLEKGVSYLEKAAENKNVRACYELGKTYLNPEQDIYDLKLGIEYLEKAAAQGYESAMYRLGAIYTNPESGFYDFQKGEKYLQEAMKSGNEYAACKLGDIYYYRQKDTLKSISYYKNASSKGNVYAKNQLLRIATGSSGNRIRKNFEFEKALRELKKSMEKDYKAWKNMLEYDANLDRRLRENEQEL